MASAADAIFQEALACEERGRHSEAKRLYEQLVTDEPSHTAARVNLGTLCYNRRDFQGARLHYEAAVRQSPLYALAHYDLANTLDELGDYAGAIKSYETGARLGYVDAHFNLARLFEKIGEPRKALLHWQAYGRLDSGSKWREQAMGQIKAIVARDALKLARSTPKPKRTKRRAKLRIV